MDDLFFIQRMDICNNILYIQLLFPCLYSNFDVCQKSNIWFVYSEKVTEMFSLNNIIILCNLTCLFQLQRLTRTEDFEFFTRISLYTIAGIEEHLL